MPLIVIQRQLGHNNLGITSIYLQRIDNAKIIETVHARRQPMIPVSTSLPRRQRRSERRSSREAAPGSCRAVLFPSRRATVRGAACRGCSGCVFARACRYLRAVGFASEVVTERLRGRRPVAQDLGDYVRIWTDARVPQEAWPAALRTASDAGRVLRETIAH